MPSAVKGVINAGRNIGRIPKGMPGVRPQGMDGLIVVAGFDPVLDINLSQVFLIKLISNVCSTNLSIRQFNLISSIKSMH